MASRKGSGKKQHPPNAADNSGYLSNKNNRQRTLKMGMAKRLATATNNSFKKPYIYLINEIPHKNYVFCKQRLVNIINKEQKEYESAEDVFMKTIIMAKTGGSEDSWKEFEKDRKAVYGISQSLGDFHEELAGKLPGYRTLPVGHWSRLDVIKEDDRTELYEFKNKPIDGDRLYEIFQKFQIILNDPKKHKGLKLLVLVFVNVPHGWRRPSLIAKKMEMPDIDLTLYDNLVKIVSGREAYAHMSKTTDFFDRLLTTIWYDDSFRTITTLSTAMNVNNTTL